MKTIIIRFVEFVCYFFILLFCYASISKIIDFENFQVQIAQSPILSSVAGFISYGVLIIELVVCFLLIFERTRIIGLYSSFFLMVSFTIYIYVILNYSDNVPCSCGGILEKMGWRTHLIFNIATVILSSSAILLHTGQRRKKIITSVFVQLLLSVLSTAMILVLYHRSDYMIKKENHFIRRFLQHPITEEKRYDLEVNSYYFAGSSKDSVYLGNYTTPFSLISLDTGLKGMNEKKIIPDRFDFNFKRAILQINAPYYYLYDGTVPVIYKGLLGNEKVHTYSRSQAYFSQLINWDQRSFIFSTYYAPLKKQSLGILSPEEKNPLQLKPDLLQKSKDGVFDTDGVILFDSENQSLVYVHYYKNQLLMMDKDLNIKGNFKTIDTISQPQIDVAELSDGRRKMNKPPLKVNFTSTVKYGLLFNQSNLMGRYENSKNWENNAVIDVYSIAEQNYIGSFYLSKPKEIKKIQLEIVGDHLFVLVGNEIIRYRFAQNITRHFIKGESRKP
ncbi:HTTM domain-containing protein [Chryseobacterium turcicum]|uniref:HTTM domain-containing protein n=1 Tax=Chryseobacterium turcicum TaxID=2898076 RepID=A0A9Q3YW23_9FLAO|nr:HTTM domain-containing protein [Chryseobacterium turcicum]MCD1117539.1 HTTM domain-containing protein [Chryseobacterium turcicum]